MSTYSIESARTNERLSAFLSEIGATKPIDNYFGICPTLEYFMKNMKTQDGGRQIIYPIGSGENTTLAWSSDYDIISTTPTDTALTVGYPFVNIFGSLNISWEEMREIAGNDHQIFDRVDYKRDEIINSAMKKINAAFYAATQVANQITALPVAVLATGAVGGLNQSTDADWASIVTAGGVFTTQGYSDMLSTFNQLVAKKAKPKVIITTRAIYELYEKELNPDVRYATADGKGVRGFSELQFKQTPIIFDPDCTSGVIQFFDTDYMFMILDTDGNFELDPFETPTNQKVFVSKFAFRGNLVLNNRRAQAKITGNS